MGTGTLECTEPRISGLILAGNMMLKAHMLSEGKFEVYTHKDLSEIKRFNRCNEGVECIHA